MIVQGYPESALALKIADWENALPENIHLAYLPNYGIVKLRLSGSSDDVLSLEFAINQQIDRLSEILGNAIVAYEDIPLEKLIGECVGSQRKNIGDSRKLYGRIYCT